MSTRTLSGALFVVPLALGIMLMGAGFRYHFDQTATGDTFGVSPSLNSLGLSAKSWDAYLTVAGIRTFIIGANIFVFTLLGDRRGTGIAVCWSVLTPILDDFIPFNYGADPWATALKFHWVPAALSGWLAYQLLA